MLQGILFFIAGVLQSNLRFRFRRDFLGITGSVFLIYAFVIYPALGYWFGHRYPAAATFRSSLPDNHFHLRHVALDRPAHSSLPIAYTNGVVIYGFLGSNLSGNDRGLRIVGRRHNRIFDIHFAR